MPSPRRFGFLTLLGGGEGRRTYLYVYGGWELLVICNLRDAIDVVRRKKQLPDVGGIQLARNYL